MQSIGSPPSEAAAAQPGLQPVPPLVKEELTPQLEASSGQRPTVLEAQARQRQMRQAPQAQAAKWIECLAVAWQCTVEAGIT